VQTATTQSTRLEFARTIADLHAAYEVVGEDHVALALQLRTALATLVGGSR
jgi:predicted ATPase with chaperone activity